MYIIFALKARCFEEKNDKLVGAFQLFFNHDGAISEISVGKIRTTQAFSHCRDITSSDYKQNYVVVIDAEKEAASIRGRQAYSFQI